jgi:hypothetical protein
LTRRSFFKILLEFNVLSSCVSSLLLFLRLCSALSCDIKAGKWGDYNCDIPQSVGSSLRIHLSFLPLFFLFQLFYFTSFVPSLSLLVTVMHSKQHSCFSLRHVVESMLEYVAAMDPPVDMVFWTGDVPPHNVWNQVSHAPCVISP